MKAMEVPFCWREAVHKRTGSFEKGHHPLKHYKHIKEEEKKEEEKRPSILK